MTSNHLITTDLDGTLLDHHNYSYAAALPAIKRCQSLGIPIILNTSKSYSEVKEIQRKLDLDAPVIVENGSAILISDSQHGQITEKLFGASRSDVLGFIHLVRQDYSWQLIGFNDWSISEIAEQTGLSLAESEMASRKQYSEPFIWQDSDKAFSEFTRLADRQNLAVMRGGRFYHLQGKTDKSIPLRYVTQHYRELFPNMHSKPNLIALGDNHNDIAMLNAADIAVCVRSPVAGYPVVSNKGKIITTNAYGPEGWNEAIIKILDADI